MAALGVLCLLSPTHLLSSFLLDTHFDDFSLSYIFYGKLTSEWEHTYCEIDRVILNVFYKASVL